MVNRFPNVRLGQHFGVSTNLLLCQRLDKKVCHFPLSYNERAIILAYHKVCKQCGTASLALSKF